LRIKDKPGANLTFLCRSERKGSSSEIDWKVELVWSKKQALKNYREKDLRISEVCDIIIEKVKKKHTQKNKIFQRNVELGRRREFEIRIRGFGKVKVDLRFEIRIGERYGIRVENL